MQDPVIRVIGVQHHRIADIDILGDGLHLEGTGIGHHPAERDGIDARGGPGSDRRGGFAGASPIRGFLRLSHCAAAQQGACRRQ